MSLKHKEDKQDSDILAPHVPNDEWEGAWGSINPSPHSVETLCLIKGENSAETEAVSYSYRTLVRWRWKKDLSEELEIQAGPDVVTISGSGLRRLMDALDAGQLKRVREQGEPRQTGGSDSLHVVTILIRHE